jgi:hypothetical protein
MARYSALVLIVAPLVALADYLYIHRAMQIRQIFSGPNLPLLDGTAVLALGAVRCRQAILDSIDRHFFRKQLESGKRKNRIQAPPGLRLQAVAEFFFSPRTYKEILEPTLRDLFVEYCEALLINRPWKVRWVRIRGYWSFWSAVVAQLPISAVKMVYTIWKATR